jgi:dihydrofolate synthase/folylpolyglutamate synthase
MAERHDLRLTDAAIRAGFGAARWPGRLEALDDPRLGRVLLDGAHNPAGARALASALADLGLRGMPLIFGAMRGKRVDRALRALAAAHPRPIFTAVDDPGALTPGELLATWRRIAPDGAAVDGPVAALERAAQLRRGDEPIVVAGSLYLVGAVRGLLRGEEGA